MSVFTLQNIDNQSFTLLSNYIFQQLSTEYNQYVFWIKLSVVNPSDSLISVLFNTGVHKSMEVFRKKNNTYQLLKATNQRLLLDERPYRFDEQFLPLDFEPKQTYNLLIKVTEHPQIYFSLKPQLVSYAAEYESKIAAFNDEYLYFVLDGIYVSILLFVGIYMFVMFFIEKKRYYLYYGLYLFFLVLFSLWAIEHSPYNRLVFSFIPALKFSGNNNTYLLATNIFYYLFIHEFLDLRKTAPKFSKIMLFYVKYVLLGILVFDTFLNFVLKDYSLGGKLWILTQPVVALFGIYGTVELFRIKTKKKVLRYIQVGSTVLLIGAVVGFMEQLLLIKTADNIFMRLAPSASLNVSVLVEIFCFSTALGYKTWLSQRTRSALVRSVKESELRTLRSQINPHFIFNSLNSIKRYILQNRQTAASEYLTDFSALMRAILQQSKEKFITLSDELETTLLYVKLENIRFEEGFYFDYNLENDIDTDEILIPPMLLQPYLENAIKHGLMNKPTDRVLRLSIKKNNPETLVISIDDNGIGREAASLQSKNTLKHQSMGMSITNERVQLLGLTNDLHIVIKIIDKKSPNGQSEGTRVVITIPI